MSDLAETVHPLDLKPATRHTRTRTPTDRLVVFTRYPQPGKTKTRMIPALGADGAAQLHGQMAEHTLRWARRLAGGRVAVDVRFAGGTADLMEQRFGSAFTYLPQPEGDLGQRMARTFRDAFSNAATRVVIVGTDCPELSDTLAGQAFEALHESDLVLGPATDGGYYLIGLRRRAPELFTGIAWGTGAVFTATVRRAARLGMSVRLLRPLPDVDRPEDLAVWHRLADAREAVVQMPARDCAGALSIIIPARDEAEHLPRTLAAVQYAPHTEVIVVDGGSVDDTRAIAGACGAVVLRSEPGRARQMNAGAEVAQGEFLLFLHADTRLEDGFHEAVRDVLSQPHNAAGAFQLRIDAPGRGVRLIERAVNLRSRYLGMPYGDQAVFVRAETFHAVGGFPEVPIMEDVELVRRLRRRGRVAIAPIAAVTSARRWLTLGLWRTTLLNQLCLGAYWTGVSPARIARWYRRPTAAG